MPNGRDPIQNARLSQECWDGNHARRVKGEDRGCGGRLQIGTGTATVRCECGCHDRQPAVRLRRQPEPISSALAAINPNVPEPARKRAKGDGRHADA